MSGLRSQGFSPKVIPRPIGTITVKGSTTTTDKYEAVGDCKHTVTKDKIFNLAKITVSCPKDVMAKVVFGEEDISIEYYIMAELPFTDWFPSEWNKDNLRGDGSKELRIEAKYPTGGEADIVFAELSGEEA